MSLSKGLARLGGAVVLAALLLGTAFAFASTANSQEADSMLLYGPAPERDSEV